VALTFKERRSPVVPVIEAVAGFGHSANMTALSNAYSITGFDLYSNAPNGIALGTISLAGVVEYDPQFVKEVLQADAGSPEASFNNVVDMLDWLNRE
jgi:hypothetical protein